MGREGTVYSRWWVWRNWWLRWPRALGARGGEDDVAGGGGRGRPWWTMFLSFDEAL
jgi:hypothetical protein